MSMSEYTDWRQDPEVQNIMDRYVEKFPEVFEGFDPQGIHVTMTKGRKQPLMRLHSIRHPIHVLVRRPYVLDVNDDEWQKLAPRQRNMAVFSVMCAIPQGGFDPNSDYYAKKVKPDIQMHMLAFAAFGGVPNFLENPAAIDPLERDADDVQVSIHAAGGAADGISRMPVTADQIADAGMEGQDQ